MSYGTVKSQFMGILNRRDITPSLVDTFMGFAIQRIHRELRVPPMEKLVALTTDGSSSLSVPSDLHEIISLHTNDNVNRDKLVRTDAETILTASREPGIPRFYHREVDKFYIGPVPPTGTTVYLNYFSDSSSLVADSDTNWLTEEAPVLLIYAALSFAADYFLDDRKMLFEQTYEQTRISLDNEAKQDEGVNASIRPVSYMD